MATRKKKSSGSKGSGGAPAVAEPRAALDPSAKHLEALLKEVRDGLARLTPPTEPQQTDFVAPLIHAHFVEGLPCGFGQEVRRRIEAELVDLNEFRVTEAYEIERLLDDLEVPDLFARCSALQQSVQQVYNDQNRVSLEYLREASISERKNFYQRVPALTPTIARFLNQYADLDEIFFSSKASTRVQQRLGWDPKATHLESFLTEVRELVAPFGQLPLDVGPHRKDGRPLLEPYLSPACLLLRIAEKATA